jgi:phospholipid/cholesterol/gamma-HCH transport system substrate-binding protein
MSRSFRIGLFLLGTLAILCVCVFLVGSQESKFGTSFQVRCEFANVAGLAQGADVRVGGIRKGTVRSIQLPNRSDGKVTVTLNLDRDTESIIKQDSVASIESAGLLGDKYVDVSFGSAQAQRVKSGGTIQSIPPLDVSDLFKKANGILDTSQQALNSIAAATDNLNTITAKINTGHGTIGKLINDKTLYTQAEQGVASIHEDAEAMKHNFLLRGFFKDRGYANPDEIKQNAISQLPKEQPAKRFLLDAKNLFDKPDSVKLKNEKELSAAGQFLQGQKFGFAIVACTTGNRGDSAKELAESEARAYVVRKYLVEKFPMDDMRLKTFGMGKSAGGSPDGIIEILIYASAPATAGKTPERK